MPYMECLEHVDFPVFATPLRCHAFAAGWCDVVHTRPQALASESSDSDRAATSNLEDGAA